MKTLKDIRDQVIDDLDLQEEDFVTETDLNRFINEAIEEAESEIHTIYEDYFLSETDAIAITSGQEYVDYPSDVFANKIRKIVFAENLSESAETFEVKRIKNLAKAKLDEIVDQSQSYPVLHWTPINKAGIGRKIRIFPKSSRSGYLYIFYIRNAAKLVNDTDVCDIDEFERFIVQYVKTRVYLKDGDPRASDSLALEERFRKNMVESLTDAVPDENNELEQDTEFYEDSN